MWLAVFPPTQQRAPQILCRESASAGSPRTFPLLDCPALASVQPHAGCWLGRSPRQRAVRRGTRRTVQRLVLDELYSSSPVSFPFHRATQTIAQSVRGGWSLPHAPGVGQAIGLRPGVAQLGWQRARSLARRAYHKSNTIRLA